MTTGEAAFPSVVREKASGKDVCKKIEGLMRSCPLHVQMKGSEMSDFSKSWSPSLVIGSDNDVLVQLVKEKRANAG